MVFNKHISEQEIIDFVLGNLNKEEYAEVIQHTKDCQICKEMVEEWQYTIGTREQDGEQMKPSNLLKKRLDKRIDKENQAVENKKQKPMLKPVYWAGVLAAVLLLSVSFTFQFEEDTALNKQVMYNEEIHKEPIQSKPNTKQLEITPVTQFNHISGSIWINDATREMLVEIDGLVNLESKNYRLWIIDTDDNIEGEPLPIQNGSVRILYQGKDINQVKRIKTSVEPVGGSVKPTGPEPFTVDVED